MRIDQEQSLRQFMLPTDHLHAITMDCKIYDALQVLGFKYSNKTDSNHNTKVKIRK